MYPYIKKSTKTFKYQKNTIGKTDDKYLQLNTMANMKRS